MMTWTFWGIAAYVSLQLVIGYIVSRRISTEDDYLLAQRRFGLGLATMTIFATWFGAETCIGSAGAIYEDGLSGGRADPFGYAFCIIILGVVFGRRLWEKKLTTLADLFRVRYGVAVEKIAVVLMVPTSLFWASAQIRAFGQVLTASSDLEINIAVTFAAAVIIVYVTMGGLLADAYTDLIQGVVLIGGLIVMTVVILWGHVDREAVREAVSPERLAFFGGPDEPIWATLEEWAVPIVGSLFVQELVARVLASRSVSVVRRSALLAGGLYLAVGSLAALLGLLGPALVSDIGDSEQVLAVLAQTYMPAYLHIVFAGALVSAILSTVDSALLAAAAIMSHNLVVPVMRVTDTKKRLLIARVCVILFGLMSYIMALYATSVYALVEESSAFASAGIFVTVLFALVSRFGGAWSAAASLVAGMTCYVLCNYLFEFDYPYLMSLGAALGGYCVIGFIEGSSGPDEAVPDAA